MEDYKKSFLYLIKKIILYNLLYDIVVLYEK